MSQKKTLWELACEHEEKHRGGMPTIFNFLVSLHITTDEAGQDLKKAWSEYDKQMNTWAQYARIKPL